MLAVLVVSVIKSRTPATLLSAWAVLTQLAPRYLPGIVVKFLVVSPYWVMPGGKVIALRAVARRVRTVDRQACEALG